GDRDVNLNAGVGRFHDGIGGERRRHVDDRGVRAGFAHGLCHRVEDGNLALELLAAFPRRHAADDLRAILEHLLCVERAIASRDALHDHGRIAVDEDAHAAFPPFASATAFCTASSMSDDAEKPLSWRIFIAICSFVPVRRMTSGTFSGFCLVAVTMPLATSSVRVMPPKMLNKIAFTLGSDVMMRSAFTTFSGFDDPPMS